MRGESSALNAPLSVISWHYPEFGGRVERGLILIFELKDIFSPNPMRLCGRIALVAKFLVVSNPQLLAHTDCALEVHTFA